MLRILSRSLLAAAIAGIAFPLFIDQADAGSRYKSGGGKSWSGGGGMRMRYNGRSLYLYIPESYLDDDTYDEDDSYKYAPDRFNQESLSYRGGPKIINVQEALRKRRAERGLK